MANCPATLQSSRRIQRSSASVRMTWKYRPDAIKCSTSNRVPISDTDMGRWLQLSGRCSVPVRTFSFIRQVVHSTFNRPDVSLHGPDAPKPYYGNCVQQKCNRPDTLQYFDYNFLFKYWIGTKLVSLKS
jgi:hypothetical protein